jgi:hypothetical protein
MDPHDPPQESEPTTPRPRSGPESERRGTPRDPDRDIDSPDYEGSWAARPSDTSNGEASSQVTGQYYGDGSYSGSDYYGSTYTSGGYYGDSTYTSGGYYGGSTYTSGGARGARSPQAQLWLRALRFAGLGLALAVSWPGILRLQADQSDATGWLLIVAAVVLGVAVAFVLGPYAASQADEKQRRLQQKEFEEASAKAEAARTGLSDLERAELERRQELADARLREEASYRRSDAQARSAYRIVQFSAATGLALLVVAFVVAVTTTQSSLQIAAASLGAIGSATAAYVGATSLAVWARALSQLNWHDAQPLVNRQLMAARAIAEKLDSGERRDAALERVLVARLDLAANAFSSVADRPADSRRRLRRRRSAESSSITEPPVST